MADRNRKLNIIIFHGIDHSPIAKKIEELFKIIQIPCNICLSSNVIRPEKIERSMISILPLRIFISHLWINYELYRWLKDMLDQEILWVDFSIPVENKINLVQTQTGERKQE